MSVEDDIAGCIRQEATLVLSEFSPEAAWRLGTTLRDLALARNLPPVIDVRRFGAPHQQLFYAALDGTTPDNQRWVARKIAVVARFHKSSYHVGRLLEQSGLSFAARVPTPTFMSSPSGRAFANLCGRSCYRAKSFASARSPGWPMPSYSGVFADSP